MAFTLTRFRTGVDATGGAPPPSPVEAWTEATFQVSENGKPTTAWEPADVIVSDATGNVWKPDVCLHEWKGGAARLFFRGALWTSEPAWKLRVEFVPIHEEHEGTPRVWTFHGAALFRTSSQRVVRNGATLRLMGIGGEGRWVYTPAGRVLTPEVPTAFVRLSPPRAGVRLRLVRATDERGRPCALSRPEGGFIGQYSFRFQPPAGAKRLDLSFADQRQSRTVEFVAAPSLSPRSR